jgi:hypothetical protein
VLLSVCAVKLAIPALLVCPAASVAKRRYRLKTSKIAKHTWGGLLGLQVEVSLTFPGCFGRENPKVSKDLFRQRMEAGARFDFYSIDGVSLGDKGLT